MPCNINVIYIPLKSTFNELQFNRWHYGSVYLHLFNRCGSQSHEITWNSAKIWPYSSSRSSKVNDLGVNPKCILLVTNMMYDLVTNPNFNRFCRIHPCDGRTDGRAVAYSALAKHICHMLSRANKTLNASRIIFDWNKGPYWPMSQFTNKPMLMLRVREMVWKKDAVVMPVSFVHHTELQNVLIARRIQYT